MNVTERYATLRLFHHGLEHWSIAGDRRKVDELCAAGLLRQERPFPGCYSLSPAGKREVLSGATRAGWMLPPTNPGCAPQTDAIPTPSPRSDHTGEAA